MTTYSTPAPRRALLKAVVGLAAMPLIGSCTRATVAPAAAATANDAALGHYVAFLAHEHREALIEFGLRNARWDAERDRIRAGNVPTNWYPDDPLVAGIMAESTPSRRAPIILAALGGHKPEVLDLVRRW